MTFFIALTEGALAVPASEPGSQRAGEGGGCAGRARELSRCWSRPFQGWKAAVRSPLSLLFAGLNDPDTLGLSSRERCSIPRTVFVALLWTHCDRSVSFPR